jgi:hypothetical protein
MDLGKTPITDLYCVDARQRNERDVRMAAAETGWEQAEACSEFSCFYYKVD